MQRSDADIQFLRRYANLLASAVERLRIVRELRDRAEVKERLLRESQQRVKKNLKTVMNLVALRVRPARTAQAAAAPRAISDGIEALRLAHDKIYSANDGMNRTCLGTEFGALVASPLRFHGMGVPIKVRLVAHIEWVEVHADCAVPLGMHRLPARLG